MQIAIVDDELEWQIKVKEYLKKYWSSKSLNIDMFIDGAEFDYGKEYDVVFLDVEMKNRDGFETAKLYRKTHENAIIIFLTSHQELCNRGYMVNAFRYIDKGNLEEELDEALTAFEDIHKRYHIITFHIPNMGDVTCRIKDIFYIETEKRIGKNIRALRERAGMTQEQLSAKLQVNGCDLTRSAVAKIEVGQRHIYPDEIILIREILKVSYEEIFDIK